MAGNETIYKSPRAFLPVLWAQNNVAQGSSVVLDVAGLPAGLSQMPMPRAGSVTAILVVMSEAITSGDITVILHKNGVSTIGQFVVDSTDGVTAVGELPPGEVGYQEGDTLGVELSAASGLTPNARIDLAVYVEVQAV